jgi:uncharacterized protein YbjT (DUF2867 family)
MTKTVLVTGATGQQGGAVSRALLGRGHRVRALTRHPDGDPARTLAGLGAEPAHGDFDDAESLRQAFKDVDAAFVMSTHFETDPATEARQGIAVVEAAREAGVGHVVYSSVASAVDDTGIPHFDSKAAVEAHLAGLGVPHTVLAPAGFLENLTAPWTLPGLREGRYAFALPAERSLQQVAVADIGSFAALVLDRPERFDGDRIELASTDATGPEVAEVLTRQLGREVRYEEIPMEAIRASGDADYVRMIEFFRGPSYSVDIAALHAAYPEVGWHSLDTWVAGIDWERLLTDG